MRRLVGSLKNDELRHWRDGLAIGSHHIQRNRFIATKALGFRKDSIMGIARSRRTMKEDITGFLAQLEAPGTFVTRDVRPAGATLSLFHCPLRK